MICQSLCFLVICGFVSPLDNFLIKPPGILLVLSETGPIFLDFFGLSIEYLWLDCPNENCGRCCQPQRLGSGKRGQNMDNWIVSELFPSPLCFVISVSLKYSNKYCYLRLCESLDPMIMAINEPGFKDRKT